MPDAHSRPEIHAGRLVLVLVGVSGLRVTRPPAAPIWVRAELIVRKISLIRGRIEGRRDPIDELRRHLVDEARRLARLVLAEDSPPRGAGQHEPLPRAGHPHIAEAALLLQFLLVVAR